MLSMDELTSNLQKGGLIMTYAKIQPVAGLRNHRKDRSQADILKRRQQKRKDIEEINDFAKVLADMIGE
mgnify:CR=1 FL=1